MNFLIFSPCSFSYEFVPALLSGGVLVISPDSFDSFDGNQL